MQLNEIVYADAVPIEGYGPDFFRVAGTAIPGNALVHAAGAGGWGGYEDTAAILALAGKIDFVLLGTGASMQPVPAAFREVIEEAGIGIEPMGSGSACRTYNVLVSEGRRVAAAVLCIGAEASS